MSVRNNAGFGAVIIQKLEGPLFVLNDGEMDNDFDYNENIYG